MKIKVCGLTQAENIAKISALGVDYLGFIFHPGSPRFVGNTPVKKLYDLDQDQESRPHRIGVFVNAELDYILNAVHDYQLDWVQLHGNESPGYCQELQLLWSVSTSYRAKIMKAFSIGPDFDFNQTNAYVSSCPVFVFDTGGTPQAGGTGKQWNWQQLDNYQGLTPFLLSGGIGPNDVQRIKAVKHPQLQGVDLNSRFEVAPGVKDTEELARFIEALRTS